MLALVVFAASLAAFPGAALAKMTVAKLRLGGTTGPEDYLYTAGNVVSASGSVDGGSFYRFIVSDPSSTVRSTTPCKSSSANDVVSATYTVGADDPTSTTAGWRFQLQQYGDASCSGVPGKTASLFFDVARATAYGTSTLTAPKSAFAAGATAYVGVAGAGKVKGSGTNASQSDWSVRWLLPSGAVACANTGGGDRPDSTSGGLLPVGSGPLGTGGFLQFRPNVVATGDAWNRESNYETRPCPVPGSANEGAWQLKLLKDNMHFVTLPAFVVDATPPETTLTSGPAGTTSATSATFRFTSSEAASTFECRVDGGSWQSCSSPRTFGGLVEGPRSVDVRAADAAGNVDPTPAHAAWTIDTTVPLVQLDEPADGSRTADSTPTISGTAGVAPGDAPLVVVDVYAGKSASGTPLETLDAAVVGGSWSVVATPPLADGIYTAAAHQSDGGANAGYSEAHTFTVDTTPPNVRLFAPLDGSSTSDTTPSFSGDAGTADGDDDTVRVDVYSGTHATGTPVAAVSTTRGGGGLWSVESSAELAEGTYTAVASQQDAVGNVGTSAARTFRVDTTPPDTWIAAGVSGATSSASAAFVFLASEPGSGFECKLDDGLWVACPSPQGYSALADGAHTFAVRAIDAAGNTDPTPAAQAWTVNSALPSVSVVEPGNGTTTNDTTPSFSGLAGTASGDAAVVTVKIFRPVAGGPDELVQTRAAARGSDGSWATTAFPALPEGMYSVRAEQAGSSGTATSAAHAFTVDTTPPQTTITLGQSGPTSSTGASFRFASSEAGSFQCRLDGGAWTPCTSPQAYAGLGEGVHVFEVRATDAAGNVDSDPALATWTVALGLPAVTLTAPADGVATNDTTPAFAGTAGSGPGDAASVTVKVFAADSNMLVQALTAARGGTGTWSTSGLALAEGTYVVRAEQAGSTGTAFTASHTFTVDATPPTTSLLSGPVGPTTSTSARFSFASSEHGSTFECRLDGDAWSPCSSPVALEGLSADSHTFEARAIDAAGNGDPSPATRTWLVDPAAPPVTLVTPADDSWTKNALPLFAGTAGTDAADLATVSVDVYAGTNVSDTPVDTLTTVRSSADGSWSVLASAPLGDGVYVAYAQQADTAGNVGVSAPRTFTVDTTAADVSLDAPASGWATGDATPEARGRAGAARGDSGSVTLKVYGGAGATGVPVRTLTVGTTGGSWSTDVSPPLADGTYTARAEQSDAAGNTGLSATRTFTIDTTAPAVGVSAPAEGAVTSNAQPELAGTAESGSSAVTVRLYAGEAAAGTAVATLAATPTGSAWSAAPPAPLADGTYTLRAEQRDGAGNLGVSATRTFTVDTTAPAVGVSAPADGAVTDDVTPTISGTAGTVQGDAPSVTVTLAAGGMTVATLTAVPSGSAWSVEAPSALADGAYTVRAEQRDAAGNTGVTAPRTFTVDTSAPDTALTAGPSGDTTSTDASFAFSATKAGSSFLCRLDGGSWETCSTPRAYTGVAVGTHSFDVRAVDALGHADPTPATRAWTVTAAPVTTTPVTTTPVTPVVAPTLKLRLTLSGKQRTLKRGRIVVAAVCDKPCTLTLTPKASISRGAHKRAQAFRLRSRKFTVGTTQKKLTLTLSKRMRTTLLRALARRRFVVLSLNGRATGGGATASASAHARLRR